MDRSLTRARLLYLIATEQWGSIQELDRWCQAVVRAGAHGGE